MRFAIIEDGKLRRLGAVPLLVLALLFPGVAPAAAQEKSLLLPMQGHVELEPVDLPIYLKLPFEAYGEEGVALDDFLERPAASDPALAAFQRLMRGLKEEDMALAGPFISTEEGEAAEAFRRDRITLWHRGFGGFERVRVLGRSDLGDEDLFYWDMPYRGARFIRSFTLRRAGAAGGYTATLTSSNWPLTAWIVKSLSARNRAPERLPDGLQVSLPMTFRLGGDRVPLLFEGYAPQFDVFQARLPEGYPPLRFYAETWRLLPKGQLEAFANRWTVKSAAKVRKQLSNQPQAFLDIATQPRWVWLVMHAEPLYFVFYTSGPNPLHPKTPVRVDTLLREPDGGFKMTNLYFESDIDQALKDATGVPLEAFTASIRTLR
jgi:hypothetical protein